MDIALRLFQSQQVNIQEQLSFWSIAVGKLSELRSPWVYHADIRASHSRSPLPLAEVEVIFEQSITAVHSFTEFTSTTSPESIGLRPRLYLPAFVCVPFSAYLIP